MDRKANFDHSQHRKGLSKSLIPLRNNNIRTTSVNLTNQFCAPKVASKALTVPFLPFSTTWAKATMRPSSARLWSAGPTGSSPPTPLPPSST